MSLLLALDRRTEFESFAKSESEFCNQTIIHSYYGCALGKAKQTAKTEMEKLKLANMTCRELVKEAAKIIHIVHDEVKDKDFELELSWVCAETNGLHQPVPAGVS